MLDVQGVSAGYGASRVLFDCTLRVPENQLVVLIGPNGHGKSTLLQAISRLIPLSGGGITFAGQRIDDKTAEAVVRLGLVHIPQGDWLFQDMTVQENLYLGAYPAAWWRERQKRLDSVYQLFPVLAERRFQRARTLSGGERRMLALGRGLMSQARLLMIDEPSLGLAPVLVDQVYARIREIRRSGMTILLVEENFSHVTDLADHVYLLEAGRIIRDGSVNDLMADRTIVSTYLGG